MRVRLIAGLILLAGLALRVPGLTDPLLGFHPTRQYRSAILARGFALGTLPMSPIQRQAAEQAARAQPVIEPPVFERAAALAYRIAGREDLRLPRAMGVLFWMAGAVALWWLLGLIWESSPGRLAGLAVCVLLPFGIPASQAFQPDGLMTAFVVAASACWISHDRTATARQEPEAGSRKWVLTLVVTAAALFIKPMAAFFIFPVMLVLAIRERGWARGLTRAGSVALAASLPAAAWYFFAAPDAAEGRVFPRLLATPAFWLGWLRMIDAVVWWPVAAAAAAGVLLSGGRARAVLLALWGGYLAFGLVFTHHIHTHDYYSLPLIPIAALSVAALVDWIDGRLAASSVRRAAAWTGAALLAAGVGASAQAAGVLDPRTHLRVRVADYERIGRLVGPGASVVSLDGDYGFPLNYHGYLLSSNWPLSIDRALARLSGVTLPPAGDRLASLGADYFVATMQSELDGEPGLHQLLEQRFPLLDRAGSADRWRYLVFDLRHPKFSLKPEKISVFAVAGGDAAPAGQVELWTPPSINWHAAAQDDLIELRPDHGVGPATIALAARRTAGVQDRTLEIFFRAAGASIASATLTVRFRSFAARPSSLPMGSVDGPGDPVAFTGSPVTFQGWALDSLDLRRIRVEAVDAKGRARTIGETRGTWSRPDVAAAYPDAHDIFNSGWAFTLEPAIVEGAALPLTLHFYGESGDGRRAEIGKRTVQRGH